MTRRIYFDSYTQCDIIVKEMSQQEALELVQEMIEGIDRCIMDGIRPELNICIEYKDGTYYNNDGGYVSGTFRKSNIKAIIVEDGFEYHIYGKYEMDENTIPHIA